MANVGVKQPLKVVGREIQTLQHGVQEILGRCLCREGHLPLPRILPPLPRGVLKELEPLQLIPLQEHGGQKGKPAMAAVLAGHAKRQAVPTVLQNLPVHVHTQHSTKTLQSAVLGDKLLEGLGHKLNIYGLEPVPRNVQFGEIRSQTRQSLGEDGKLVVRQVELEQ